MAKYKRACVPGSHALHRLQRIELPDKQSPSVVQGGAEVLALQCSDQHDMFCMRKKLPFHKGMCWQVPWRQR